MQRKLFKFATLNSFKMVWMVSVVLFTCVIANAQITLEQKRQVEGSVIASCIENFRIVGYKPDSITVSFTTSKPLSTRVRSLNKWRYYFGATKHWVRADDIGNNKLYDYQKKDHLFTIPVGFLGATVRRGEKFQLVIDARNNDAASGGDHTFGCSEVFTVYDPKLNNLRLRPKPKQ